MKRLFVFAAAVLMLAALSGCGKKQEMEELQPITMESLSTAPAPAPVPVVPDVKSPAMEVPATKELVPLPPQGPFNPTATDIQTALKNAGFYTGNVDGKIGPKSKKAIEDFQQAHNLKADGKVGPKTWEALSKYLTAPAVPSAKR